jgi:hypothetical protein
MALECTMCWQRGAQMSQVNGVPPEMVVSRSSDGALRACFSVHAFRLNVGITFSHVKLQLMQLSTSRGSKVGLPIKPQSAVM